MSFRDLRYCGYGQTGIVQESSLEWKDGDCHYQIPDEQSPSEAVIGVLNECLEREHDRVPITEQPPLFDAVNPDALDEIFTDPQIRGEVQFTYVERAVTVNSGGEVIVSEP